MTSTMFYVGTPTTQNDLEHPPCCLCCLDCRITELLSWLGEQVCGGRPRDTQVETIPNRCSVRHQPIAQYFPPDLACLVCDGYMECVIFLPN